MKCLIDPSEGLPTRSCRRVRIEERSMVESRPCGRRIRDRDVEVPVTEGHVPVV